MLSATTLLFWLILIALFGGQSCEPWCILFSYSWNWVLWAVCLDAVCFFIFQILFLCWVNDARIYFGLKAGALVRYLVAVTAVYFAFKKMKLQFLR